MRGREKNSLLDLLVDAGLYLLDPVRERMGDHIDTVSAKAKDVYQEASGRVRKASRAITGEERSGLSSTAALLLGVGVGVALGILFAPASGEQVRRNIAETAREFGGRIRSRKSGESGEAGTAERL